MANGTNTSVTGSRYFKTNAVNVSLVVADKNIQDKLRTLVTLDELDVLVNDQDTNANQNDGKKVWVVPITSMARVDMNNHFSRAYVRVTSAYFEDALSFMTLCTMPEELSTTAIDKNFFIALTDDTGTLVESTRWYFNRVVRMGRRDAIGADGNGTNASMKTLCIEFVSHPYAALKVAGVAGNDLTFENLFWDAVAVPTLNTESETTELSNASLLGKDQIIYGSNYINRFSSVNGIELEAMEACVIPPGVWTLEKACSVVAGSRNAFYKPLSGGINTASYGAVTPSTNDAVRAVAEFSPLEFCYFEYRDNTPFQWAEQSSGPGSSGVVLSNTVGLMDFHYRIEQGAIYSCIPRGFSSQWCTTLVENTLLNNESRAWVAPSIKKENARPILAVADYTKQGALSETTPYTCTCSWFQLTNMQSVATANQHGKILKDSNSADSQSQLIVSSLFLYHADSVQSGADVLQNARKILLEGIGLSGPFGTQVSSTSSWACFVLTVPLSQTGKVGGIPDPVSSSNTRPDAVVDYVPVPVHLLQEMIRRQDVLTLFTQAIRQVGCGPVHWPDYYVEPKQEITYWPAFVADEMSRSSTVRAVYGDSYENSDNTLSGHVKVHIVGVKGQVNVMRGQVVANIYDIDRSQGAFHRVLTPGAFVKVELIGCTPFVTDSYHLHNNPVPLLGITATAYAHNVDLAPGPIKMTARSGDIEICAPDTLYLNSTNKEVGVNQSSGVDQLNPNPS